MRTNTPYGNERANSKLLVSVYPKIVFQNAISYNVPIQYCQLDAVSSSFIRDDKPEREQ